MKQVLFTTISAVIIVAITALKTEHELFIDRDIESRKLQGTARYLGCFRDTGSNRALPTRITDKGRLNVAQCNAECSARSFQYAGRQYLGECYCGNSGYNKHGVRNDCNPCDSENVGPYKSCVYDVSSLGGPQSPTNHPSANKNDIIKVEQYKYLGCYSDKRDRALPLRVPGTHSVSECNIACTNQYKKYSARQYNGECYCGNGDYDKYGSSNRCGPCNGSNIGGYLSCVYEDTSFSPSNQATIETTTVERYLYLGCYKDSQDRALPLRVPGRLSVTQCNTECTNRGMKYSARQYTGECYCGNGNYAKHGSSNRCAPCDSANVGKYLSCIYQEEQLLTPRYIYLGCYKDSQDRALPLNVPGRLSVTQCNIACTDRGMKYSARQYTGECYCGNGNYAKHGSSNRCAPCDNANVGEYLSCVYENLRLTPIDPGDLKVVDSFTGLKLSEGLKVRLIASADTRVALTNGRYSQERFFKDPDGAAVFPRPGGGWYYVINSEQWNRNSGVSTLVFDSNGQVEDYQVRIKGTYRNCGGGKTPWGTWVSCEEYANGQCIQIDPSGARSPQVTNIGESSGGNFESFAYDDRDRNNPCFFATEDHPRGSLRRYCPNVPNGVLRWEILHQSQYSRTYLKLNPTGHNHGTYEWTTSKAAGENSANAYYPNSEGIDRRHQFLYFVSKVKRRLVIVNLDNGTYRWESINNRLFSGDGGQFEAEPDQVIFSLNEDNLFFTEDGGRTPGIYVRTPSGAYNTLVQAYHDMYVHDETVSLAFSPDSRRMYFGIQEIGRIFEVTRIDGGSFRHLHYGRALLRGASSSSESEGTGDGSSGLDLVMGLKFHTLPSS